MEQELQSRPTAVEQSIHEPATRELVRTLEKQPVRKVQAKVVSLIDELLSRTFAMNADRSKLFNQVVPKEHAPELVDDITLAMQDLERGYQLQQELIQMYEEITPGAHLDTGSKAPIPVTVSGNANQTVRQRKSTPLITEVIDGEDDGESDDRSRLVKGSGGYLALYSLALWFLGIVSAIFIVEYVSIVDWAAEVPAAASLIY